MRLLAVASILALVGCGSAGADTPKGAPIPPGYTCIVNKGPAATDPVLLTNCDNGTLVYDPVVVTTAP